MPQAKTFAELFGMTEAEYNRINDLLMNIATTEIDKTVAMCMAAIGPKLLEEFEAAKGLKSGHIEVTEHMPEHDILRNVMEAVKHETRSFSPEYIAMSFFTLGSVAKLIEKSFTAVLQKEMSDFAALHFKKADGTPARSASFVSTGDTLTEALKKEFPNTPLTPKGDA